MKKLYLILLTSFFCLESYAFVVLIDPGHGGKEYGAISKLQKINSKGKKYSEKVYEKDLTLKLGLLLKKELHNSFSTYLTRSIDRTVSLEERAELAETVKADVFISIHFNSARDHKSHGFETYYLDNHKDKAIRKVEAIENKGLEGDKKVINQILIDLVIQKTVPTSKKLASYIHEQIVEKVKIPYKLRDRGIKPGLFYVLALSKRPGILIEAGFMSEPNELGKIIKMDYLRSYAKSIAEGIKSYQMSLPKKEIPLF